MKLHNLKDDTQVVDFETAVKTGLGNNQGLFFPKAIAPLDNIDALLKMTVKERNFYLLKPFVSANINDEDLRVIIDKTFEFPAKLVAVNPSEYCLELFHGPTLSFKDFGANFMANCLTCFEKGSSRDRSNSNVGKNGANQRITILTATSGDTGAAVAHAFHNVEKIQVVILFPKGKISELQQKMFTTLGGNIHTIAIEGSFDDCQQLVKQSFDQPRLIEEIGLNSANSINISRLMAQVCYYFDAFSQMPINQREEVVIAIPSGNFGNLCAGMIAKVLGLPIKRFIAATNVNDTVPRFLQTGDWLPEATIATQSNAMDVSKPNNWPRIQYLMDSAQIDPTSLTALAVDEKQTQHSLRSLYSQGYTSEPHTAVAYYGLHHSLTESESGIFLGTAHPAKFKSTVEDVLNIDLSLPPELADCVMKQDLSVEMAAEFSQLEEYLYRL